ncbi:methylglyoxal synthase [Leptospira borgpetersenii serovar Pomona str. 200901868]|uniref:Methylglyoxal synthase n=1 Tax=Leptospira borgpetersenii serovar Pomona str. 200901868 TaxID=1192866 RepID=M6WB27_LEPBO|nr:methylglyoxal synthase [Leptospira borgpetersenii serovar Pomona str. 200901868]
MKEVSVPATKRIALVAHDNRKEDLVSWVKAHREILSKHRLFGTGTTGKLISEETGLPVTRFLSGPLGGDQQIGAKIAEGDLDIVIFFWDPLTAQPHDPDVKALLRIAVLYNVPMACNRSTADYMISSPQFTISYEKVLLNFELLCES